MRRLALGAALVGVAVTPSTGQAWAQAPIVTDGTMGARVELSGPDITVPHTLGTASGGNLFHSFQRFNVPSGGSATFTGPAGFNNVIGRVTGGEGSLIDGSLRSTVPGADVWLINPAGITFGPGATLDVPASFHASTADEIRFPDGARFSADLGTNSTLSVAPPEAFGFLGAQPQPILVDRSSLAVQPGETLALAGGGIDLQGNDPPVNFNWPAFIDMFTGTLRAPAGTISLSSVSGPAEVTPSGAARGHVEGPVKMSRGALVNVSSNDTGTIRINGGDVEMSGSYLLGINLGSTASGAGITLDADRVVLLPDTRSASAIVSHAFAAGTAAPITVKACEVTIGGNSGIGSVSLGEGDGATLTISADQLVLADGGTIFDNSTGPSDGGDTILTIGSRLDMTNQASLQTRTFGTGSAGSISIIAPAATVSMRGPNTQIAATSGNVGILLTTDQPPPLLGSPGSISIKADRLQLFPGSAVDVSAYGTRTVGRSAAVVGTIYIDAETRIDMAGTSDSPTGILALTAGEREGGNIRINAPWLELAASTLVISSSLATGKGGDINVDVGRLNMGPSTYFASGPFAGAFGDFASEGSGGTINIKARDGLTMNAAGVSSQSTTAGPAGAITIKTSSLQMTNNANISSASSGTGASGAVSIEEAYTLTLDHSFIATNAQIAGGGNISIKASERVQLQDSSITSAVAGGEETEAGNIMIDPKFVILDNSTVSAQARDGKGGRIDVDADYIFGLLEQITASSERGVDGTVVLNSGENTVVGSLTPLPDALLDASGRLQARCAVRGGLEGSSFTIVGPEQASPALQGYLAGTFAPEAGAVAVRDGTAMVAAGGAPLWPHLACRTSGD